LLSPCGDYTGKPARAQAPWHAGTFCKTGLVKRLRDYLLKEATIESVVDFGDLQIFEDETAHPAVL